MARGILASRMPDGPDAVRTIHVRVRYPFVSEDASMKRSRLLISGALAVVLSACGNDVNAPTKPTDAVADDSAALDLRYAGGLPTGTGTPERFLETFDGSPTSPFRYVPSNWDMSRYVTDGFGFEPMQAMHGADCSAPPATHLARTLADVVFQCKDHVMTAVYTRGYGQAVLTPNRLVDFTNGTAVVGFDVSTLRTAGRDWIDLWITPYSDHLQFPLDNGLPAASGAPRRAVQVEMVNIFGTEGLDPKWTFFVGNVYRGYNDTEIPQKSTKPYSSVLTPSATTRSRFELRISRTHVKFGMPDYNLWWIDSDIADLGWTQGVVQLGHHSYHPVEDSDCLPCKPDTWHWDNVEINPAIPFTIIPADRMEVAKYQTNTARFARPAPAGSFLRFAAIFPPISVSFDNGKTWTRALVKQPQRAPGNNDFTSFWTPVPQGTTTVRFKSSSPYEWTVRDISIWSLAAP